ncbi:MAG: DNA-deoxyinosine glycosylase, partial [Spirochaetia bacterium]|nr:DNA-deoxyinosine glycosylase [Spirochaetia bacterium]
MLKGFPPIEDHTSRILILGTGPSVRSLQKQQYYG